MAAVLTGTFRHGGFSVPLRFQFPLWRIAVQVFVDIFRCGTSTPAQLTHQPTGLGVVPKRLECADGAAVISGLVKLSLKGTAPHRSPQPKSMVDTAEKA